MSMLRSFQKGFSLIELMVVIGIIGVLTSIGIGTYVQSRNKATIARATADMETLKKAMILYKLDMGELPPIGDNWSAGSNPPNSSWKLVVDALMQGGYLKTRIDTDPWGNYYGYDDNDCNLSLQGQSPLYTVGPDKIGGTTDDIVIIVTDEC